MMAWEIVWLLVREHVLNGPALGASCREGRPGTG
jgi:hypothetical protein